MRLIVGLGNHTGEYVNTFHNIGFIVLDKFLELNNIKLTKTSSVAKYFEGKINNEKVIIIKPTTFMNLSGNAVSYFARKFKIELQDIIVVYDDIDLPLGALRFRISGSAGTHNGMRDIVTKLGSTEFNRLRIGIGPEKKPNDLANYVLSKISAKEKEILMPTIKNAALVLNGFIKNENMSQVIENLKNNK